jgi:hypothetical protein
MKVSFFINRIFTIILFSPIESKITTTGFIATGSYRLPVLTKSGIMSPWCIRSCPLSHGKKRKY